MVRPGDCTQMLVEESPRVLLLRSLEVNFLRPEAIWNPRWSTWLRT